MGGWSPGAGCQPGWHVEPRKQSGQRVMRKAHHAGRPARTGWTGGNLDAGLGQEDACLQAGVEVGGVVVALSPQLLPAQISRQESRARWHGQADKVTGCSQRRGAVGPGGAPASLLPGRLCPHLSSKARERTGSRSINAKTGGPQLLTLGLIKSISPSILIQLLSTAIRWVIE